MKCTNCEGRGQIYQVVQNKDGEWGRIPHPCLICNCTGQVPGDEPVKPSTLPDSDRLRRLSHFCPIVHATLHAGGSVLDCLEFVVADRERLLQELVTVVGNRPPAIMIARRGESPDTHVG